MKILILANNDIGIYKFRKELIEKLISLGHEVYISLPYGEFVPLLKQIGCKFVDTPIDRRGVNPLKDLKLFLLYKKIIKKTNPNVVLSYTIKPNVYGGIICTWNKVPYISNITGLGTAVENKGILQLITTLLYKFALQNAQTVFFQNVENEKFFSGKKIAIGKHKMLPGSGVNLSFYQLLPYPNDNIVEFVFVGRIMKEKGIDQYLNAAKVIHKRHPNTRFHVCGFCEQAYEETIQKLQNIGIIIYHGLVDDMREIYKVTHCTIHPTFYPEGLSNVLLESAACGRPIITTNRAGCREVVDNGINGFTIKEKDSRDLIDKIEKFLQMTIEEKREMGLAGRKKVEKYFNRQIVINKYLLELEKL